MPAASGGGKSTLAGYLVLRRGYELLSDEVGAFDLRLGKLLPFARSIGLKPASVALLGLEVDPASGQSRTAFFPAGPLGLRTAAPTAPVLIVAPRFEAGRTITIERLPSSAACAELLAQSRIRAAGPAGLDAVLRFAREVPCYRMTYGHLEAAADGLEVLWRAHFAD
ncbi:MAG TPA: hypothetical protein VMM92_15210 [Thermoanaerobaculia bacterium]|nr:hypothetical protein [Thermoanaerobaculia bacterium]